MSRDVKVQISTDYVVVYSSRPKTTAREKEKQRGGADHSLITEIDGVSPGILRKNSGNAFRGCGLQYGNGYCVPVRGTADRVRQCLPCLVDIVQHCLLDLMITRAF
ncbi:hypothetical protein J6590_011663 [Homalodisca vitripennis]|nr:hypothetical protein J6590_011663 [Homalodisca vitripennis]